MPIAEDAKTRMEAALEALRREFATVRTGKATPALLDTVRVDAYGSKMPLNQLATISTPESSLLVVQPFDKTLLPEVERAIMTADLGLETLAFQHLGDLFLKGPQRRGELLTKGLAAAAGKADHPGPVGVLEVIHIRPVAYRPALVLAVQVIDDALEVGFDGAGFSGAGEARDK